MNKYPNKHPDFKIEIIKGDQMAGYVNKAIENKYQFIVYISMNERIFDKGTLFEWDSYFESGFIFDSIDEAANHYLKFHLKDINNWIIKRENNLIYLWYKSLKELNKKNNYGC